MKKKHIITALLLSFSLTLSACNGKTDRSSSKEEEKVPAGKTISLMGKKSDLAKSYMTSIFNQYEQATGNKLEIIAYDDVDYETEAQKKFAKGEVPDIFLHFNNAELKRFDVAANFRTLNDQSWVSDLTDSAKAYCLNSDGDLLGLPYWESSVSGCYYNKRIMDELGLKAATDQAEFNALCKVLMEAGYVPICWPADGCSWMLQFGLDPIFADDPELLEKLNRNEITYADIPAVADMLSWISNAADSGWFGEDYMSTDWDAIGKKMSSGDAVMTFIWDTWFYTDLPRDNTYSLYDFGLMPVFVNTADDGTYEGGNLNMMMVNKNGKNVDEALAFLEFCATSENYNKAFDGISTVSCFKGQNTNVQSHMVTEESESIQAHERVSTASTRIIGYSGDDMVLAVNKLLNKEVDVDGCIKLMDELRMDSAKLQGAEGF